MNKLHRSYYTNIEKLKFEKTKVIWTIYYGINISGNHSWSMAIFRRIHNEQLP